jgi:hypothetical protein
MHIRYCFLIIALINMNDVKDFVNKIYDIDHCNFQHQMRDFHYSLSQDRAQGVGTSRHPLATALVDECCGQIIPWNTSFWTGDR